MKPRRIRYLQIPTACLIHLSMGAALFAQEPIDKREDPVPPPSETREETEKSEKQKSQDEQNIEEVKKEPEIVEPPKNPIPKESPAERGGDKVERKSPGSGEDSQKQPIEEGKDPIQKEPPPAQREQDGRKVPIEVNPSEKEPEIKPPVVRDPVTPSDTNKEKESEPKRPPQNPSGKKPPEVSRPPTIVPDAKEPQIPRENRGDVIEPSKNPKQKGEVIRLWEEKWGYNSASRIPKASLWVLTDTGPESKWVTPVLASTLQAADARSTPKNPFPCPGSAKQVEAPAALAITLNGQSGGAMWSEDFFDPTKGRAVDIEAQIDIVVPASSVSVALLYGTKKGVFMGSAKTVRGKAGEFTRVDLSVGYPEHPPIVWQLVTGEKHDIFIEDTMVTFGVIFLREDKNEQPLVVVADNFEVRVASKCTDRQREEEKARNAEFQAAQNKLVDAVKNLNLDRTVDSKGLPDMSSGAIAREEQQHMVGKPDKPITSNSYCNARVQERSATK